MKCPNCERSVSINDLRCRVCHRRLPAWYALTTVLGIAFLTVLFFLME